MILATVGSSKTPFDRMVKAVDELAATISEPVIIQRGAATYEPRYARYFDFCVAEELLALINTATVVIAHAGFGVIAECLRYQKRLILIPRQHRFGDAEGIQIELAEYLAENVPGIVCVTEVNKLADALSQLSDEFPRYHFKTTIPALVNSYISKKTVGH